MSWEPIHTLIAALALVGPPIIFLIWRLATLTERNETQRARIEEVRTEILAELSQLDAYAHKVRHEDREEFNQHLSNVRLMVYGVVPQDKWR